MDLSLLIFHKLRSKLTLLSLVLILVTTACNLPALLSGSDDTPIGDTTQLRPTAMSTPRIQNTSPADSDSESEPTSAPTSEAIEDIKLDISPAASPAIPDCNALDINIYNAIIEGTFTFITQDQLNNCHYESDNGFRLMIGGGKPTTVDEIQQLFDSSFGALPDSTWGVIDNFYLGLAYSSVSVTAQGVSSSGHSIVIVVASQPGSDPATLKTIFTNLAQESAKQLNMQFQ